MKQNIVLKKTIEYLLKKHAPKQEGFSQEYPSYYVDYHDNLFEFKMKKEYEEEFKNGKGKETQVKGPYPPHMASVASSSAMLFNLLGNDNEEIEIRKNRYNIPCGIYHVEFEKEYQGLFSSYVDANLTHQEGKSIILIENKMLESINPSKKGISNKYIEEEYYNNIDNDIKETYLYIFNSLTSKTNMKNKKGEYLIIQDNITCDFIQIIKHTLGFINEYTKNNSLKQINKVYLLSLHYSLPFNKETADIYGSFQECNNSKKIISNSSICMTVIDKIKALYKRKGLEFDYYPISYAQFAFNIINMSFDRSKYIYSRYFFNEYEKTILLQKKEYTNIVIYQNQYVLFSPYEEYFPNEYEISTYVIKFCKYLKSLPIIDIKIGNIYEKDFGIFNQYEEVLKLIFNKNNFNEWRYLGWWISSEIIRRNKKNDLIGTSNAIKSLSLLNNYCEIYDTGLYLNVEYKKSILKKIKEIFNIEISNNNIWKMGVDEFDKIIFKKICKNTIEPVISKDYDYDIFVNDIMSIGYITLSIDDIIYFFTPKNKFKSYIIHRICDNEENVRKKLEKIVENYNDVLIGIKMKNSKLSILNVIFDIFKGETLFSVKEAVDLQDNYIDIFIIECIK